MDTLTFFVFVIMLIMIGKNKDMVTSFFKKFISGASKFSEILMGIVFIGIVIAMIWSLFLPK